MWSFLSVRQKLKRNLWRFLKRCDLPAAPFDYKVFEFDIMSMRGSCPLNSNNFLTLQSGGSRKWAALLPTQQRLEEAEGNKYNSRWVVYVLLAAASALLLLRFYGWLLLLAAGYKYLMMDDVCGNYLDGCGTLHPDDYTELCYSMHFGSQDDEKNNICCCLSCF